MQALVDCNNFFVSCERVFDPGLRQRPVAVLSSNDGCIVARSNEVKDLGVPMGAPAFKYRQLLNDHRVVLKSSNFAFYTDMSRRVMATLREYTSGVEVYSVDEAFIDLSGDKGFFDWAYGLRDKVLQDTGIPVSVGVAPTRTLAKAAATLSKRRSGVLSFTDLSEQEVDEYLRSLPAEDVWGVGRKLSRRLRSYQVSTAYGVRSLPEGILNQFNVSFRRTVQELKGIPSPGHKSTFSKSMVSSRSFGKSLAREQDLLEALTSHALTLAARLRREGMVAEYLSGFIATGAYEGYRQERVVLSAPTSSSRELAHTAAKLLQSIYRPGLEYKKSGLVVHGLVPATARQLALDGNVCAIEQEEAVDAVFDVINQKYGPHALGLASEGEGRSWRPKHAMRSPRYTTEWSELPRLS